MGQESHNKKQDGKREVADPGSRLGSGMIAKL